MRCDLRRALLSSCLLLYACGGHPPAAASDDGPAAAAAGDENVLTLAREAHGFVRVDAATLDADVALVRAPGRVAFRDGGAADVASTIGGRVVEVHVSLGERVVRGAKLATLRSPEALVARAEAKRALASLHATAGELARVHTLAEAGVATEREVLDATLHESDARAEHARAAAALALLGPGSSGDRIELRAPIDGVVIERNATLGTVVAADGSALFRVGDPSSVWVEASVFERDLSLTHVGSVTRVALPGLPLLTGRVASVSAVIDGRTRTATARIVLDDAPGNVRPGMYGRIEICAPVPVIVVPTSSVIVRNGRELDVFVEREAGSFRFERREITVGPSHRGRVSVLSGVSLGERIVTRGALLLDGTADLLL